MKFNKEEQINELTDYVMVEAIIECTNYNTCKSVEGDYDDSSLAENVYAKGWRVINGDVLCQKCVRKLNAKKKK